MTKLKTSLNQVILNYILPFLDDRKMAARTEQLARAPAPAMHTINTATTSGGTRGKCASSDIASSVRDCIGINDSRTLRHSRSPPSVPLCVFFFGNESPYAAARSENMCGSERARTQVMPVYLYVKIYFVDVTIMNIGSYDPCEINIVTFLVTYYIFPC